MLTQDELKQIKDYIFEKLPQVLETDAHFAVLIEGMLAEKFPRRDEFNRLLDELTQLRLDQNAKFEQVDRRFEQVDANIENLRREQNEKFQQVDNQFEQVDRRFEQVDEKIENLRREQNEKFQQVDRRFDLLTEDVHRLSDRVDAGLMAVGNLQSRVGRNLEDLAAGTLRYALNRRDISPENVELRKSFVDHHGQIGPAGRDYEIDIFIDNSSVIVFEVKSNCDSQQLLHFNDKAEFIRKQDYPDKPCEKVLITLEKNSYLQNKYQELGIVLV